MPFALVEMIFLVCLLCFLRLAFSQEGLSADEAVDSFLTSVIEKISDGELDEIKIKDVYWHYKYYHLSGRLFCDHGSVMSLQSLKKTDAVNVTRENNTINITIPLELGTLRYRYEDCDFKILNIFSFPGKIYVTALSNSIEVKATTTKEEGKCEARLSSVEFIDLDKIKIRMVGGMGKQLETTLKKPLIDHMKKYIAQQILEKLEMLLPLATDTLCDNFNQLYQSILEQ